MLILQSLPKSKGGTLAQLVEQWTENPCVPGSIPGGTTKSLDWRKLIETFSFLGGTYGFYPCGKTCFPGSRSKSRGMVLFDTDEFTPWHRIYCTICCEKKNHSFIKSCIQTSNLGVVHSIAVAARYLCHRNKRNPKC